ncbi:MAG: MarR family transcriptional regulator [Clostridia bacterium]|nr:MarR family transcriptional regulator [Clostridia bacterium]
MFVHEIDRLYKCVKGLENDMAERINVKSVHIFWIYSLFHEPNGLTASEIARRNNINRSLVSREITRLEKEGVISYREEGERKNKYNAKIVLTEKGREIAQVIFRTGVKVQHAVGQNVTANELKLLYSILGRMSDSLSQISIKQEAVASSQKPDLLQGKDISE